MQPQNQTPENNPQPSATPPPPTFGDHEIQPSAATPDATGSNTEAPDSAPSQPANNSPQTYPNPTPVTPSGGLQPPIGGGSNPPDSRVSARVPMVCIYAWAVIGYAIISFVISLISMAETILADLGLALVVLGPWLLMGVLFGPGLQVLIGVYLLFANSLRNVSIVLTILLVLRVLGFFGSLASFSIGDTQLKLWDITSLAISAILLVLLWQARAKVEAGRKPRELWSGVGISAPDEV